MNKLPHEMTAIAIREPGGPHVLVPSRRPLPVPGEGEILIKVAASGVNRPDVMQRMGLYPPPPGASDIPGLEVAGEVVARGAHATRWNLGDRVCALVSGGGYAEYCVAHETHALAVPANLALKDNIFERGGLKAGESVLVHGGSSGIGTTAIQLAKAFGATVFVTAGTDEKCRACVALGADRAINYRTENFVAVVKAATGKTGVNLIIDMVGGDYIERNYEAAAVDGRVVQIAIQAGGRASVDFSRLMLKRLTHTGSTLRSRSVADKAAIARAVAANAMPLVASGKARPVIDSAFALAEAAAAHARMETSHHIGKILLLS
jgi:NADPH2:quinone reductase